MSDHRRLREVLLGSFNFQVAPAHSEPGTCPAPEAILLNFLFVNLVVAVLGIILGHSNVMNFISCGMLGQRNSKLWTVMWIPVAGLQILANILVAVSIKRVPGYDAGFTVMQLAVFYTVRPRIGWILSLLFSVTSYPSRPRFRTTASLYPHPSSQPSVASQVYLLPDYRQNHTATPTSKIYPWRCAALSQFLSEMALQIFALYNMGRTTVFAARHGYYIIGNLNSVAPGHIGKSAHMMYSAALYWLCGQAVLAFLRLVVAPVLVICFWGCGAGKSKAVHRTVICMAVFMIPLSWVACWLFWVGYVRLAGDL